MAPWALISGESGVENAAFARSLAARLQARGLRVAGYVQEKLRNERGEKRYELARLGCGDRAVLAVDGVAPKGPNEEGFCSMAFHNEAFEVAGRWVEQDAAGADLLVLDGISKLEVSGKGHSATLDRALARAVGPVVLVCARASQLSYVMERFTLGDEGMVAALELPAEQEPVEAFVRELAAGVEAQRLRRGAAGASG